MESRDEGCTFAAPMKSYKSELKTAIQAALSAGNEILDVYSTEFMVDIKEDQSPLTDADMRSHKTIVSALSETEYPILSEEGAELEYSERKSWTTFWLVDPLDGTKEFVKRNGDFTVNIALVEENLPVMGVIYVPVHKELYFAAQGIGAFKKQDCDFRDIVEDILDESELIPMDLEGIEEGVIRVVASRSHPSRETQELIQELEQEYDKVEVVSRGSSLKMCLIAEGSAEVYPRLAPTMEWDTAAGQAICEVAGFQVLEHKTGLPLTYNKENLRNPWFIVS